MGAGEGGQSPQIFTKFNLSQFETNNEKVGNIKKSNFNENLFHQFDKNQEN